MSSTPPPLADTLDSDIGKYKSYGTSNYIFAYLFTAFAVIASVASTVLVATGNSETSKWLTATLSATPALVLLIVSTFRFEQKSAWQWRKTRALQALHRQLLYEGKTDAEVSPELSRVEAALDGDWVPFGKFTGSTPAAGSWVRVHNF